MTDSNRVINRVILYLRRPLVLLDKPQGDEIRTCTIITCAPNKLMERIHNRMPAVLESGAHDIWLDPVNQDDTMLTALLNPYSRKGNGSLSCIKVRKLPGQ